MRLVQFVNECVLHTVCLIFFFFKAADLTLTEAKTFFRMFVFDIF